MAESTASIYQHRETVSQTKLAFLRRKSKETQLPLHMFELNCPAGDGFAPHNRQNLERNACEFSS